MKRNSSKKQNNIKRQEAKVRRLVQELEEAQQALNSLRLQEDERSIESVESNDLDIGDYVVSKTSPYHNGIVESFSSDRFWVYIRNKRNQRVKKAAHNVRKE